MSMPTISKEREYSEELGHALQSISERWQGNLSAYLEALAKARQAAESTADEDCIVVRSAVDLTRLAQRRQMHG